jgi:hypothetical protein
MGAQLAVSDANCGVSRYVRDSLHKELGCLVV